jgi:hypothetical protein
MKCEESIFWRFPGTPHVHAGLEFTIRSAATKKTGGNQYRVSICAGADNWGGFIVNPVIFSANANLHG